MFSIQNKKRIFIANCIMNSIALILFCIMYISNFIKSPYYTTGIGSISIASIILTIIYIVCITELLLYINLIKSKKSKEIKQNIKPENIAVSLVFLFTMITEFIYSVVSCMKLYTFTNMTNLVNSILYILCIIFTNVIYARLLKIICHTFIILNKEEE